MPTAAARTPARKGRAILAMLTLLLGGVAMVATASPASALSSFAITVTSPEPLIAGATGFLDVTVYNAGPDVSDQTVLEVEVPEGLTAIGSSQCVEPNGCTIGGFGLLNVGESETRRIMVDIDPSYVVDNGGGAAAAEASIQTSIDYDAGAQSNNRLVSIGELSDLRISRYVNPPVADAGQPVSYTIDVDNFGPSTARDVTIADTLLGAGSGVAISSCAFSVAQGGGIITQFNCTTGPFFVSQFGTDIGTLRTDELIPVGVVDAPDPTPDFVGGRMRAAFFITSAEGVSLDNQIRVTSATDDPNLADNLTDVAHSFQAVADLSVTATPDLTAPAPGDTVTYTVEATNNGSSTAGNVVVEHHVPAGLDVVSATSTAGSCTTGTSGDSEDPVECLLGTVGPLDSPPEPIPATETITVEAIVTGEPGDELVSETAISSATPDRDNADDVVESVITVGEPNLAFNSVEPARLFDTRTGAGGVPVGRVPANTSLVFDVGGVAGVPSGAEAVALNVTVTGPLAGGNLVVFPCDDPGGAASNLNFATGQTVANAVLVQVDGADEVCFRSTAAAHVIADVSGFFVSGNGFNAMTPVREFDTRNGSGGVPVGPLTTGTVLTFDVTGVNGVPSSGVAAVALNVTAATPGTSGHVTVFPCGEVPNTSSVNHRPGATVPNLVIAPVSPDGTVCFRSSGTTHLVVDASGWFDEATGLVPLNPSRVFDTRNGLGGVPATRVLSGAELEVDVTGRFGVPDDGVGAVILNVTAVAPLGNGHVTVYPCGDRPLTSNLNYLAGRTVPNAVLAPVSPDGTVCFSSFAATHLVVDISGYVEG